MAKVRSNESMACAQSWMVMYVVSCASTTRNTAELSLLVAGLPSAIASNVIVQVYYGCYYKRKYTFSSPYYRFTSLIFDGYGYNYLCCCSCCSCFVSSQKTWRLCISTIVNLHGNGEVLVTASCWEYVWPKKHLSKCKVLVESYSVGTTQLTLRGSRACRSAMPITSIYNTLSILPSVMVLSVGQKFTVTSCEPIGAIQPEDGLTTNNEASEYIDGKWNW